MMNNEKEKDAIDTSKLDEILPKYDPLKLNSINLAQNYVSAFNTGMNIYQCVNQLQGYIEWVVKDVNDVVKSWNVQVGESIDQSKAIVRETTTEQFNVEWTNKQPELIEQVNTLTTNQFNEDWGVLENRINTTLETQNTNIQNIQNEQNELENNTNNNINAQNTKINTIQTQQTNLANEQNTLSNRMDTFTSLSSGSTTGDAELQDIRVGANGVTYPNAGDAVRGQYSQLKEDLSGISEYPLGDNVFKTELVTNNDNCSYTKNDDSVTVSISNENYYSSARTEYGTVQHILTPNKKYRMSCDIEVISGNPYCLMGIRGTSTNRDSLVVKCGNGSAGHYSVDFVATEYISYISFFVSFDTPVSNSSVKYSNIKIEEILDITAVDRTARKGISDIKSDIATIEDNLYESVGTINRQYIDIHTYDKGHYWGYDSATHNYNLESNQYFDCLQVENLKSGRYKLSKNDGIYNGFAVNISTNKAYSIYDYRVSELETDEYYVIDIPFDFNFLLTVESYKRHDYMLCDNEYPDSYVYGIFGLNLNNTALEKTLENYQNNNNVFYCGVSRKFTKLKDAIEEATKYMDSIVYVDNGIYDLVTEFGTRYLDSYNGTDNIGIILKNRVRVVFSSGAKVVFDYQGTNEKVHEYFSPFNSGEYGFTLENAYVESKNCRYSVHDERAHFTDSYHNIYKRCTFIHDSSNASGWHASQAIGGGLGKYGDILIEDCYCKSVANDDTISFHSTTISESENDAKSKIIVKGTYTTGTLDFIQLGNSNQKTPIFVHNCNLRIEPKLEKYGSVDTMELTSWGNTIRSQS